jgi:hypothetical protein
MHTHVHIRRSGLTAALLALQTIALVAWFSGASSVLTWWFYGGCLELLGPGPIRWLTDPLRYEILGRGYRIDYWCTPTSIWTGGFLLIWAGARDVGTLLRRAAVYSTATFAALALNVVLSIWIHPLVPGWYWGHIPGTVIIYVSAFVVCLAWIFPRSQALQRRGRARRTPDRDGGPSLLAAAHRA